MATSVSIASDHALRYRFSDRLFYDLYAYSLRVQLAEISSLRGILEPDQRCHHKLDRVLQQREHWRNSFRQKNYGGTWAQLWAPMPITTQTKQHLHDLMDQLSVWHGRYRVAFSDNVGYFYSNDVDFLDKLRSIDYLHVSQPTKCVVNRARDTILLHRSDHVLRSYLRGQRLTDEEKLHVSSWLKNNHDSIRLSPALRAWCDSGNGRVHEYFFFDHSRESNLTMMSLVKSNMIRKTVIIDTTK
jgi:hypothetical protein